MTSQETNQRLTVQEAAEALGVTADAGRARIKRGTIGHERDGDRVFVFMEADESRTGRDQGGDEYADRPELVDLLRGQVEDLRADRDAWREQARRSDYLLGTSMERTRELEGRLRKLEAPQDVSENAEPHPGPSAPTVESVDPKMGAQRPWWRRVFGG